MFGGGGQAQFFVLKLCLVIFQVIISVSNSKLAVADNEHAMKVASDHSG
ncbi:hypothetical protein Patl1_33928 [Pistacia atlantica]|uniref:Uncharacterized protein n=1 Tax=Pistacia atlantica TaxID=434234 RepID=A0ACC0ZTJ2_9ROSI|nr:hypothetical protein Patl1_33928 [Pistacia atlantica]